MFHTTMSTLASRLLGRYIKPSFIQDHIRNRAAYVSLDPGLNAIRKHSSDASTEGHGCKSTSEAPKKRVKTPIGKLDELEEGQHPYQEKEPLKPWPNSTNPHTGEVGGPKGPEPTRYGDWERKGRVSDF